jgi:hypothetical protein
MVKARRMAAGAVLGLGAAALLAGPAAAQSRVVVPIVIPRATAPAPRAAGGLPPARAVTAPSRGTSVVVTTERTAPRSGVTETRVTVENAPGAVRLGAPAGVASRGSVSRDAQSVLIRVERPTVPPPAGAAPAPTRITVRDVSRAVRDAGPPPVESRAAASAGTHTVTIVGDAPVETPIVILAD